MIKSIALSACVGCLSAVLISNSNQPSAASTLSIVNRMICSSVPQAGGANRELNASLLAAELSQLNTHDVVLIIDKSYSMAKLDCGSASLNQQVDQSNLDEHSTSRLSRWQWCHQQTLDLAEKTRGVMADGITVVLFSHDSIVYNDVDAKTVQTIFSQYKPEGGTKTSVALKTQLDQYFERKQRLGNHAKPLLVAIITDGCPDEPFKLRDAIIDCTQQMTTPNEISITFLQIGNDPDGSKFLQRLNSGLDKAQFDIVNVIPFTEMRKIGLARALVSVVATR